MTVTNKRREPHQRVVGSRTKLAKRIVVLKDQLKEAQQEWSKMNKQNQMYQKINFETLRFLHHLSEKNVFFSLNKAQIKKFNKIILSLQK